jgi:hypothetical protein
MIVSQGKHSLLSPSYKPLYAFAWRNSYEWLKKSRPHPSSSLNSTAIQDVISVFCVSVEMGK